MTRVSGGQVDGQAALVSLGCATGAIAVGITLSATVGRLPGSEPLSVEDGVDAVAMIALGGLGVLLVRRQVAVRLGQALVLTASLVGATWLCGGLADVIAAGGSPPLAAQLLNLVSAALFIPGFVLLVEAPLLLFPTGRLPSPRWILVPAVAVVGTGASLASLILAPGDLDEDVPAWGRNPLGVDALGGLTDALEAVGLALVLASALASAAAVLVRLARYRGARRRQMCWFLAGALPMVIGLLTDVGASDTAQVISAVVIFGGLLGGMGWALLGPPGRIADAEQATQSPDGMPIQTGGRSPSRS